MIEIAKRWARDLKNDVVALYIVGRDPPTPRYGKAVALAVAAYAISPIDLIPDFTPVVGYVDDIILAPLNIMFAVRLIPVDLTVEFRHAAVSRGRLPAHWAGAAVIVAVWIWDLPRSHCRLP
jgi:uncharacterized membrane protein YkvA (DUF1232 family)